MMKLMNLDVTNATFASQLSILLICTNLRVILVPTMHYITLLLQPCKSLLEATIELIVYLYDVLSNIRLNGLKDCIAS